MYLFTADVHIKLGQKNVPISWQWKRFQQLANEINKLNPSTVIIGGDLLDVPDPSVDELGLMFEFLSLVKSHKILIPGNHEMVDSSKDCFQNLATMLAATDTCLINTFETINGIDFIPYNVLKKDFPKTESKIAVTHVRGAIPPHVVPEVELSKFAQYEKVFAGDLHSHTLCQENLLYPGSPLSTSFHRNRVKGGFGVFLIHPTTFEHNWVELDLPQLIRKTVTSEEEMVQTPYDHTIYELTGDFEKLGKVKKSELLDKKIVTDISKPPTLNMSGDIEQEVQEYLQSVLGIEDVSPYITKMREVT